MVELLVLGVSSMIFTLIMRYVQGLLAAKLVKQDGTPTLSPEVAGMIVGVAFFVLAFFLLRKFKDGILATVLKGMGAAGIALAGGDLVAKYIAKK